MSDGKTDLYKILYGSRSDKTHGELIEDLEERFENYPSMSEVTYKKRNGKDKGDIDFMVSSDDKTIFYEVKGGCGYGDLQKGKEQLQKQIETFDNQTENVEYRIKLGDEEAIYGECYDETL